MAIVVFISTAILFIVSFIVTPRRIHLFEGIVIWSVLQQIQNNYTGILGEDLKLINISQQTANFLVYDVIRCVIVPLAILLFLEKTSTGNRAWSKIRNGAITVVVLAGIEYLAEALGIMAYDRRWTIGWVFAYWTTLVALSYATHRVFRTIAHKEVRL